MAYFRSDIDIIGFFYLVGSPKVGGAGDGKHKKKYGHPYKTYIILHMVQVQDLLTQLSNMERRNKRLERRTRSQEVSDQVDTETQTESPPTSHVPADLVADDQHVQEIQNELDISDAKVNQLMDRLMQQRNFEVRLHYCHQNHLLLSPVKPHGRASTHNFID